MDPLSQYYVGKTKGGEYWNVPYTIQPGDNFNTIMDRFGVAANEITGYRNDTGNQSMAPGSLIYMRIPATYTDPRRAQEARQTALSALNTPGAAPQPIFNVGGGSKGQVDKPTVTGNAAIDAQNLRNFNAVNSGGTPEYDSSIIPTPVNQQTTTTPTSQPQNYIVKSGDSLSKIAAANGMSVAQLLTLNPQYQSNPNLIKPGETINMGTTGGSATNATGSSQGSPITSSGALWGSNGGTSGSIGAGITPTGNPALDASTQALVDLANSVVSKGYTIPTTLQITPDLISTFLSWAHQNVDPQTQQLLGSEAANINSSLKNFQVQHDLTQGGVIQQFGTDLASEQNTAGGSGTAFSGLRGLTEKNLVNTTNRTLTANDSNTAFGIGSALRTGAANVGSANTDKFNLPTIAGSSVSNAGGSRGSFNSGPSLDFGYNPSIYTAGNIPTAQNTAVNNMQGNFLSQYSTLAANNSNGSRSVNDLLGMISGRPANAMSNLN